MHSLPFFVHGAFYSTGRILASSLRHPTLVKNEFHRSGGVRNLPLDGNAVSASPALICVHTHLNLLIVKLSY